jgi:hypothetical protein
MPGEPDIPAAAIQSAALEPSTGQVPRSPLALKFIAFLFLLEGTLGITGMLLKLFVIRRGLTIDMAAFFTPFIGYGLLRGKESSRKWALFLTWLMLIAFAVCIVAATVMAIFGTPPSMSIHAFGETTSPSVAMILFVAIAIYCVWQIWILRHKNVLRFIIAAEHGRIVSPDASKARVKTRQYSLSAIFLITLLAAFVMMRVCADDVQYIESSQFKSMSVGPYDNRNLRYGMKSSRFFDRPDRLTYVLLYNAGDKVRQTFQSGSPGPSRYCTTPDGQEISSYSPHQLYEIVDGKTRSRDERITLEELMSYVEGSPAEWSLEALVRHAEKSRAGKQVQADK